MCTCIVYKNLRRHSYTHSHMHTVHTHSISLNDMGLTHIDRLIFVGVCGSVKAPLTYTFPYSTLSTLFCTTHLQDGPTSIWLLCFLHIEGTCKLKLSAPFSFLHRLNKLGAMRQESQSIKSQGPGLHVSLEDRKREQCSNITVC